jgi:putative alpha-1,2-mannosidase
VGGVVLGTPMFDKVTLQLAGGRTLVITREGDGVYVQSVKLDGVLYPSSWLPISNLHTGTTQLHFTMSQQPDKQRGTSTDERPPSFR